MIWLPIRCPVLNPMEHLWRAAKHSVCANRQDVSIDLAVLRVLRYLRHLTPREALQRYFVEKRITAERARQLLERADTIFLDGAEK